ncbi:MAG: KamA family radical SAM protein [Coriobacteriia bacterium]|nr:KamA family radical SAM protein [Coriobacteriia bacterium]MBN2841201.1 KamA family radical SAM protein [Coriobacteriia bacterium]
MTTQTSGRQSVHGTERLARPARCIIDIDGLDRLSREKRSQLERVTTRFPFRANDYYLGLIDWEDPHDPIRRLVVPGLSELDSFGLEDASDEASNTRLPGLQHKYADTALLLVTDQCAAFCRYCFRKRLFTAGGRETTPETSAGIQYIREHPEITDVLLTGGDALSLPTAHLEEIVEALRAVDHLHTIRLGSKILAYNPMRVLTDERLQVLLERTAASDKSLYLMCHFDHPREFTPVAREALELVQRLGVQCVNQSPITAGVNDDEQTLSELLQTCTDLGCPQYYIFQCRPTIGNASFAVPITRALSVITSARAHVSGLSRRARYCLSHASGKVEVVGMDADHIYAHYHRAKDPADEGRMLVYHRDDKATWLDDLIPADQ